MSPAYFLQAELEATAPTDPHLEKLCLYGRCGSSTESIGGVALLSLDSGGSSAAPYLLTIAQGRAALEQPGDWRGGEDP